MNSKLSSGLKDIVFQERNADHVAMFSIEKRKTTISKYVNGSSQITSYMKQGKKNNLEIILNIVGEHIGFTMKILE